VAERALTFTRLSPHGRPALVNGAAAVVVAPRGRPFAHRLHRHGRKDRRDRRPLWSP